MSDYTPSHWHEDECKAFIMSYAEPATAPCICKEVRAAHQRVREDVEKAIREHLLPPPTTNHWDLGFNTAIYEAITAVRGNAISQDSISEDSAAAHGDGAE